MVCVGPPLFRNGPSLGSAVDARARRIRETEIAAAIRNGAHAVWVCCVVGDDCVPKRHAAVLRVPDAGPQRPSSTRHCWISAVGNR